MLILRSKQSDQLANELRAGDKGSLIAEIQPLSESVSLTAGGLLLVRSEQMKVFQEVASSGFEDELCALHKKRSDSGLSKVLSDEELRETVRCGIGKAQAYGFTERGLVRFFVELMVRFGKNFDTDPLLPWAAGVLNNEAIKDQRERAVILREAMEEFERDASVFPG